MIFKDIAYLSTFPTKLPRSFSVEALLSTFQFFNLWPWELGKSQSRLQAEGGEPDPAGLTNKPEQEREEGGLIGLEDMIDVCLKEAKGLEDTNWAEVNVDLEMRDQGRGVKPVCFGGVAD